MRIRKAEIADLNYILDIYKKAREFMACNGNETQWKTNYPTIDIVEKDIANGNCYVCLQNEKIVATFAFIIGIEPTYQKILGQFHSEKPYGTIHRLASGGEVKGISKYCFDFCADKCNYLRIDTHKNNKFMLAAIKRYNFQECGIIQVLDGSERIAFDYQK